MNPNHAPRSERCCPRRWMLGAALGLCLAALPLVSSLPARSQDEAAKNTPHAPPPPMAKDVKVLFSGKADDLNAHWVKRGTDQPAAWKLNGDAMTVRGGDIETKEAFLNYHLHVEYKTPFMPNARGQGRGNSGIGLQARYEIQVLDSYGIETPGKGDAGAVYAQAAPLVNASKPPREWQTYDIIFRAPRFGADGKKSENARVTVIQNGVVVQNNQEITGATGIGSGEDDKPGRIVLQDHGNPVEFRNIWIMPLPAQGSPKY